MIYDCIVLGVGGVGSFAFRSAAQRGWKTLGIDRFGAAHDLGSSHGRTRIIRTAYFEHPNYVPLTRKAWDHWESLQSKTDLKLVQRTGLLQVGDPNGDVIQGVLQSAKSHEIAVQRWSPNETMKRFPAFNIPASMSCVFEEAAGYLMIENCVSHAIRLGIQAGGQFKSNTLVDQITLEKDGVVAVRSGENMFRTERLIITAGPWSNDLIRDLNIDIKIVRKPQTWFQLDRVDVKYENGFPAFLIERSNDCYYGFPEIDYLGMKIAEHSGGTTIESPNGVNRDCQQAEVNGAEQFLDEYLHFTRRRLVHHSVCMYSMSKDGHFVVDRHPESERIVFAAGLSGHGYKFAPVLGERLVELLEGKEDPLFDFLKIGERKLSSSRLGNTPGGNSDGTKI